MKPQVIIEILDAAHMSAYIESPFPQRGGIMLVGPPGVLKTSLIKAALQPYPSALPLSDLNINSVMSLRESMISGRYHTIAFPEFEKLYQRRADTASNVEGTIKQLIEEGFTRASFEEQDAITTTARTLVIGAMTYNFYNRKVGPWREGGFKRRILWVGIKLRDPARIMQAIRDWELIELDGIPRRYTSKKIPFDVLSNESKQIEGMLRGQYEATPYVLLKKIFAVLKWKYKSGKKAMDLLEEFSACINGDLGIIDL